MRTTHSPYQNPSILIAGSSHQLFEPLSQWQPQLIQSGPIFLPPDISKQMEQYVTTWNAMSDGGGNSEEKHCHLRQGDQHSVSKLGKNSINSNFNIILCASNYDLLHST